MDTLLCQSLKDALIALDMQLTGKTLFQASETMRGGGNMNDMCKVEKFAMGDLYYLSDGGYSRIYVHGELEDATLCLASESRDQVYAKWQESWLYRKAVITLIIALHNSEISLNE